jgi:hypothetical protein
MISKYAKVLPLFNSVRGVCLNEWYSSITSSHRSDDKRLHLIADSGESIRIPHWAFKGLAAASTTWSYGNKVLLSSGAIIRFEEAYMVQLRNCVVRVFTGWNGSVLALAGLLILSICSSTARAQSGAGSIQGTVADSTGAVVPGATIHVVNDATRVAVDTKSSNVGFYQVPSLFTGRYVVTVTASGFKTYTTTVELQVAQTAVINPMLSAGSVTQQVVVASNVVQLTTTDSGTISSTLESNRINQLPMNGRMLLTLAGETTPGLESTGQRANGLMPEALEYVADGVPLTNRNFGGVGNSTQAQLPDPDAVAEVRIETTDTSAQYSEPATGIITTKSGTNSLHGTAFWTARNNYVGIAKNRNNLANFSAPHLVRNEFGASAGGPITLPHVYHGKDKSFWFFAYERYSLAQSIPELVSVPSAAMRTGDFSNLVGGDGLLQQLYDPSTTTANAACPVPNSKTAATENNPYCRTPFKNNQVPIGSLSPMANIYYHLLPQPTPSLASLDPLTGSNLNFPNPTFVVIPTITWRLDHSFNEANKAYLRYTSNNQLNQALRNYPSNAPGSVPYAGFPVDAAGYQDINIANYGAGVGYDHVFSPTFFSETVLGMQWFMQYVGGGGNPNLNYEKMMGLPNNFGETGFPSITSVPSPQQIISILSTTQYQYKENQIIANLDENLTKTVGRHQMQFGGRYRHERFQYLPDRQADTIAYSAQGTALEQPSTGANYGAYSDTGYGEGDFYLGSADSYSVNLEPPDCHYHDMEFDLYFQDNFHISRNFTLNIGGRYEAHPAAWTKYGLTEGFDLKNHALVLTYPTSYYIANGYTTQAIITNLQNIGVKFESPSEAGYQSVMINNYDLTFSPRLALAWQPFGGNHGTVVRGAYGRYIYPVPVRNSIRNTATGIPFAQGYSMSYTNAAYTPDGLPNYLVRNPQVAVAGQTSGPQSDVGVVDSTSTTAIKPGVGGFFLQPNYAPDFVTEMNFTIEQQMKGNSAFRLTWLWSHGTNLDHYYYPNGHPSNFVWEMATGTVPPTGGSSVIGTPQQNTYASTATGPYDNNVWGSFTWDAKNGWSNDNALQANYQRLFHNGTAYQITYVWSKPFRVGGNYFRDANVYTALDYLGTQPSVATMTSPFGNVVSPNLPPKTPSNIAPYAEWHGLDVFEQYQVDSAIPLQHIQFNGIVDLPFGRGKHFLSGANRAVDELVGGWELAGDGSIASQDFQLSAGNYGGTNPIHYYKHGAKFTDCRSGNCHPAYLWFNGFIPPTSIQGPNCTSKCVSGLPSDYQPYEIPIDDTPGTSNYNTNNVQVSSPALLASNKGNPVTIAFSPGNYNTNRYSKTFLNGPMNYTADLSLFKVFPITEHTDLRVNVDAFNVLNMQGFANPSNSDGTEQYVPQYSNSYNTPRQVQFTARFTF